METQVVDICPKIVGIVAVDVNSGIIGNKGNLPWKISEDMKRFALLTKQTWCDRVPWLAVGRKTFESLPPSLPGRKIVGLSSSKSFGDKTLGFKNFGELIASWSEQVLIHKTAGNLWIGGGGEIYNQAMVMGLISEFYVTQVWKDDNVPVDGDAKMDLSLLEKLYHSVEKSEDKKSGDWNYRFVKYVKSE